jgi:hypothetical protein
MTIILVYPSKVVVTSGSCIFEEGYHVWEVKVVTNETTVITLKNWKEN